MTYLSWLFKAAIFFTLFAFALNNQQLVAVNFFFGTFWQANLVLVVLAAFSVGLLLGLVLMMPRWWRSRQRHQAHAAPSATAKSASSVPNAGATAADTLTAARDGL